jgi:hypothetical protein
VNLCDRVLAVLQARPGEWIDGRELSRVGGYAGYRTRISDLRKPPYSQVIENRVRTVREHAMDCPRLQFWDANEAECPCACGKPRRFTVSEYRLVAGAKTEAA